MPVSLVFGLGFEHFCPWPQEGLSLASKFFCVLGLESCILDSTSDSHSWQAHFEPFFGVNRTF